MRILITSTLAVVMVLAVGCGDEGPYASEDPKSSNTDFVPAVALNELAAGEWRGAGSCMRLSGDQYQEFQTFWHLCPDGNMKGVSVTDTYERNDEGVYGVNEPDGLVTASYWSQDDPTTRGSWVVRNLEYDAAKDILVFQTGCVYPLHRYGTAYNSDCN